MSMGDVGTTSNPPTGRWRGRRSRVILSIGSLVLVVAGAAWVATDGRWGGLGAPDAIGQPAAQPVAAASPKATPGSSKPAAGEWTNPSGQVVRRPVRLDQEAAFGDGVTAKVLVMDAIAGSESGGFGDIDQPGIKVTIRLTNRTPEAINLDAVVVDATYGSEDAPASPILQDTRADFFSGSLASGRSARGTYLFVIPTDQRDDVTITVSYEPVSPIVAFQGSAPRA